MSQPKKQLETTREWLAGVIVVVATIVSFIGFAFASLKWTLIVASLALVVLVGFLWSVGIRKQRTRRKGNSRR